MVDNACEMPPILLISNIFAVPPCAEKSIGHHHLNAQYHEGHTTVLGPSKRKKKREFLRNRHIAFIRDISTHHCPGTRYFIRRIKKKREENINQADHSLVRVADGGKYPTLPCIQTSYSNSF